MSPVTGRHDCDGCYSPSDPLGEWYDQTLLVGAADFRAHNMSFAGSKGGGRNMALQVSTAPANRSASPIAPC